MWILLFGFSQIDMTLGNNIEDGFGLIAYIIFNIISSIVFFVCLPSTTRKSYYEIFTSLKFDIAV